MPVVKEDRRIRRTRKLLQKSLAELMNEKEFQNITVKDITERADVNRGTFYLHYTDPYDLLKKIEDDLILELETMIENYQPTQKNLSAFPIINQIFDYLFENMIICRTLLNSNSSALVDKLVKVISERGFTINRLLGRCMADQNANGYRFQFIAYGLIGIVTRWLQTDMQSPAKEEMAGIVDDIIRALL